MQVPEGFIAKLAGKMAALETERQPYFSLWRECADYTLPRRYVWLNSSSAAGRIASMRNPHILDATPTIAARVLASGMMNGITSPARPWFSLRIAGRDDIMLNSAVQRWLDETTRRMMLVMSQSNFYNAMAVMYLDLVVFGTSAMLVYEDYENVIRCYNPALGEYYLAQDDRLQVNVFARKFHMTVAQMIAKWGEENVSENVKRLWKLGGASTQQSIEIHHMIEPNTDGLGKINKKFRFRETYWEPGKTTDNKVLAQSGFREMPGLFPRWELCANDSYGSCPAMEALGDNKQLQQESLRKAQGIDKIVTPPVLADVQLQNKPTALIPGAVTYVSGVNNIGVKPIYQVTLPLAEMTQDLAQIQERIREIFHNPLFTMISQLDTVRSATEVDARREEKLVLLGPVLERFENEALDPAINRIYSIMQRAGLIPDPPEEISNVDLEIQYTSILSTAQKAIAAAPTERWIGMIGNLAGVKPEVLNIPDWEELVRGYGRDIGVPAKYMTEVEVSTATTQGQNQQVAEAAAVQQSSELTKAAQQLSATDVGGGANALQVVLGNT